MDQYGGRFPVGHGEVYGARRELRVLLFLLFAYLKQRVRPLGPKPVYIIAINGVFFIRRAATFQGVRICLFALFRDCRGFHEEFVQVFRCHRVVRCPVTMAQLRGDHRRYQQRIVSAIRLYFHRRPINVNVRPGFLLSTIHLAINCMVSTLLLPFGNDNVKVGLLRYVLGNLTQQGVSHVIVVTAQARDGRSQRRRSYRRAGFRGFRGRNLFLVNLFRFVGTPLCRACHL